MSYNTPYLYDVSCYDCINCLSKNYRDPYCKSSCAKCSVAFPGTMSGILNTGTLFYNPSYYPNGNYFGGGFPYFSYGTRLTGWPRYY